MSGLTLVIGGARSGKSTYAETSAKEIAGNDPVLYIATAWADDAEMELRIARHVSERPTHWITAEEQFDPARVIREGAEFPVCIVDCVTMLLTNFVLKYEFDYPAAERYCQEAVNSLIEASLESPASVIVVTNEVGLGIVPDNPLSRFFRDVAGRANQRIAVAADRVVWMVAGIPVTVKRT